MLAVEEAVTVLVLQTHQVEEVAVAVVLLEVHLML